MELTQEFIEGLAVNEVKIMSKIAEELSIQVRQVSATVSLINEGCTVPFISRYRKEATGTLDEVQVRDVSHKFVSYTNLESRRLEIIRGIFAQGKLTEDLFTNLQKSATLVELEDIYAPYKKKKKTRGMLAQEKGLEPLADIILSSDEATVRARAREYVKENTENPELSVHNVEEAIQGAKDIIAEKVSQNPDNRALVKSFYFKDGRIVVKGIGDEDKKSQSVYQMYWDYKEQLSSLKPHRVLAVNRGEREGMLEVMIEAEEEVASGMLERNARANNAFHIEAIKDGLHRLLSPAVLREIRGDSLELADGHGIGVFGENLKNLLLQPPIKGTRVLGVDPGIRTGTKCAALDETGKFLGYFVVNQERDPEGAKKAIGKAVKEFNIQLIAVGNGTASHETQKVVAESIIENGLEAKYTVVDEDGASVYSASDLAREEFPELDLTIRGAVSIGRRLQDPLAELVKIDPKSIGVGLYQHDVNQKKLSDSLDEVVGSVVNNVGVNINTASYSLLKYVSGINASLAKKIVKHRDENGKILSRENLKTVAGMGPKSFEQCAGFLKIPESLNPLDNTWVHPENYRLAEEILPIAKEGKDLPKEKRAVLKEKYSIGDTTLDDILSELKKPNRDPRDDYPKPIMSQGVLSFEDLKEGMKVTGKVKNVVDFGAFVDIGIKESALVHISEISDRFVEDPMEVLKVGDVKEFRIISLDTVRKRIGLSLKSESRQRATDASSKGRLNSGFEKSAEIKPAPVGSDGKKKVLIVKKTGTEGKSGYEGKPAANSSQAPRPEQPFQRNQSGPRKQEHEGGGYMPQRGKEDDGTKYNPFADLLKTKKK